jgi:hypothetical protein
MEASSSPEGRDRNASSISAARASRRLRVRSGSAASPAMTRPVAASAGMVLSWAARALTTAAVTLAAIRGGIMP